MKILIYAFTGRDLQPQQRRSEEVSTENLAPPMILLPLHSGLQNPYRVVAHGPTNIQNKTCSRCCTTLPHPHSRPRHIPRLPPSLMCGTAKAVSRNSPTKVHNLAISCLFLR